MTMTTADVLLPHPCHELGWANRVEELTEERLNEIDYARDYCDGFNSISLLLVFRGCIFSHLMKGLLYSWTLCASFLEEKMHSEGKKTDNVVFVLIY